MIYRLAPCPQDGDANDRSLALVDPAVVLASITHFKQSEKKTEIAKAWPLSAMLAKAEAAALKYARDCSFDEGHAKELTSLKSTFNFPAVDCATLGENFEHLATKLKEAGKLAKAFATITGSASQRFRVTQRATLAGMQTQLEQFQSDILKATCALYWRAIEKLAEAGLQSKADQKIMEECDGWVSLATDTSIGIDVFTGVSKDNGNETQRKSEQQQ